MLKCICTPQMSFVREARCVLHVRSFSACTKAAVKPPTAALFSLQRASFQPAELLSLPWCEDHAATENTEVMAPRCEWRQLDPSRLLWMRWRVFNDFCEERSHMSVHAMGRPSQGSCVLLISHSRSFSACPGVRTRDDGVHGVHGDRRCEDRGARKPRCFSACGNQSSFCGAPQPAVNRALASGDSTARPGDTARSVRR